MPFLRVGDIWRNKELHFRPPYELETFESLKVGSRSTTLVKAGVNLDGQGFLIPAKEHPWHMQCTHSYCLMVELPGARRLLIPCMELARFYFESSGALFAKLFTPGLKREDLYSDVRFDPHKRKMWIVLAPGIPGNSATDIARLARDPDAWRAALTVSTSLQKASLANEPCFVQAKFPFADETTLTAAGKWLTLGRESRSTFLVYNLRTCAHKLPFDSLEYEVKDGRPRVHRTQFAMPKKKARNSGTILGHLHELFPEEDPSMRFSRKNIRLQGAHRFPDLIPKSIRRANDLDLQGAQVAAGGAPGPNVGSVGESGSDRRIRPVELSVVCSTTERRSQVPSFLSPVLDQLGRLGERVQVRLLTQTEDHGWTVPVQVIADDDGVIADRLFIERGDSPASLRRACALEVTAGERHTGLVALEGDARQAAIVLHAQPDVWRAIQEATLDFLARRCRGTAGLAEHVADTLRIERPHGEHTA